MVSKALNLLRTLGATISGAIAMAGAAGAADICASESLHDTNLGLPALVGSACFRGIPFIPQPEIFTCRRLTP
jgi:hypothetical protein